MTHPITAIQDKGTVAAASSLQPKPSASLQTLMSQTLSELSSIAASTAQSAPTSSDSSGVPTYTDAEIRQMISEALTLVAQLIGELAKSNANIQQDEVSLAQAVSKKIDDATKDFVQKLDKMIQEENDAHSGFFGFLSDVFGSTAGKIILGILGCLLCETGVGLALMATVTVLSATGKMDDLQNGLAGEFEKLGMSSSWAQVCAGVTIIVASIAVGGTAEGSEVATREASVKAAEDSGEVSASAWNHISPSAGFYNGYTTIQVALQEMMTSNLIFNFMVGCGANKDSLGVMIGSMIISLLISAGAMGWRAGAFKGAGLGGGSLPTILQTSMKGLTAMNLANTTLQGLQAGCNINAGINLMDQGKAMSALSFSQRDMHIASAFQPIINAFLDAMTKYYQTSANADSTMFKTDFATAWEKAAQIAVEVAG